MNNTTTRCPHCGADENDTEGNRTWFTCGTYHIKGCHPARSSLCCQIEETNEWNARANTAEAEVALLTEKLANTTAQRDAAINTFLKDENDRSDQFRGATIDANKKVEDEYCETAYKLTVALERTQELEAEVARLAELVEWYKSGIEGCWHAANTYDGNYTRACDNVMTIASARLNHKINHTK